MAFQVKIHQTRALLKWLVRVSSEPNVEYVATALSESIQELKRVSGATLFRRSKGVTLTDAGSFYQHASLLLKSCAQPKRIFANDKGNWQGRLIPAWLVFPVV